MSSSGKWGKQNFRAGELIACNLSSCFATNNEKRAQQGAGKALRWARSLGANETPRNSEIWLKAYTIQPKNRS